MLTIWTNGINFHSVSNYTVAPKSFQPYRMYYGGQIKFKHVRPNKLSLTRKQPFTLATLCDVSIKSTSVPSLELIPFLATGHLAL